MNEELKPCPFCGCELEKHHTHYIAINSHAVDYDSWDHPDNGCVLAERICENDSLLEQDIDAWNRRAMPDRKE